MRNEETVFEWCHSLLWCHIHSMELREALGGLEIFAGTDAENSQHNRAGYVPFGNCFENSLGM